MDINDSQFVVYRRAIAANREVFLLKFPGAFLDFLTVDEHFSALATAVSQGRLQDGKTLVSFFPFLGVIQRQIRNAFESFSIAKSYQGWVLLRL